MSYAIYLCGGPIVIALYLFEGWLLAKVFGVSDLSGDTTSNRVIGLVAFLTSIPAGVYAGRRLAELFWPEIWRKADQQLNL